MVKNNLGPVTAYADAVAQGYQGTREQFGKDQAAFAANAAQVAADKETVASDRKAVEAIVPQIAAAGAAALESIPADYTALSNAHKRMALYSHTLTWEQGTLGTSAGAEIGNTNKCRTTDYITPVQRCSVYLPEKYRYEIYRYNLDDSYVGYKSSQAAARFELAAGYKYRLVVYRQDGTKPADFIADLPGDIVCVDGYLQSNVLPDNTYFARMPWHPSSHYIPTVADEVYTTAGDVTTALKPDAVYAMYDELAAAFPDLITVETLGQDATGAFDIRRYSFAPEEVPVDGPAWDETVQHPKVLLFTGTHGGEHQSVWSLAHLLREIYTNWQSDPVLEFLRWNVRFVIVPCVNPYGMQHASRTNGNGVDINRNYAWRWDLNTQSTKGSAAFSEPETQYVRDTLLANADCLFALDYHSNGESDTSQAHARKFYWDMSPSLASYRLKTVAGAIASRMTARLRTEYGYTGGLMGHIIDDAHNPKFGNYCAAVGIQGCNPETPMVLPAEIDSHETRLRVALEYIGNVLMYCINVYTS